MRFRKSISICKGVKLNFSKSGISATVGGKGISANLGKSGIYLNTSIPGTGLYDRKRIVKFDSTPGRKTNTSRVASKGTPAKPKTAAAALPESVTLALGDDGAVQVFDQDGAQVRDLSVLAKLKSTASYRQAYDQLTEQSIAEANADTEAFVNIGLLSADVPKAGDYERLAAEAPPEAFVPEAFPDPEPTKEGIRAWLEAEAKKNVTSLAIWNLDKKREDYVRTHLASAYMEEHDAWQRRKAEFEARQRAAVDAENASRREAYERRVTMLRQGMNGAGEDVEAQLEAWLGSLELPIDFDVDFEYDAPTGTLLADMDLPEIQDLPAQKMVELSTGKLKTKDKTQKELRAEYSRCVFGLGMFCASHFFCVTPHMRRILLSGYTQRRNQKTGEVQDEFIYSVIFNREPFEVPGYQTQDPEHFLNRFKNRMNIASTGELKKIVPYEPDELKD